MFNKLIQENGQLSLTRVLTVVAFAAFLVASAYLILSGQTWSHYDTFASLTAGGGLATQVANKFVNSKYNSPPNEPFSK